MSVGSKGASRALCCKGRPFGLLFASLRATSVLLVLNFDFISGRSHPAAIAAALSRFTKEGKNLCSSAPFSRWREKGPSLEGAAIGQEGLGMRVARSAVLLPKQVESFD